MTMRARLLAMLMVAIGGLGLSACYRHPGHDSDRHHGDHHQDHRGPYGGVEGGGAF